MQQWVLPYCTSPSNKAVSSVWITSIDSEPILGLFVILSQADLYLLHYFLKVFPHCWKLVERVWKKYLSRTDFSDQVQIQKFTVLKTAVLQGSDKFLDCDRLDICFKFPIKADLETHLSKLVHFPQRIDRSIVQFRLQLDAESKKHTIRGCHWAHPRTFSNQPITISKIRGWGQLCWTPKNPRVATNKEKTEP